MKPNLFFDLDGTLTDPKLGITRSIQHAFEQLGEPVPEADELTWCIGPPMQESFLKLFGADRAERALALYRERYAEIGLFENTIYPGVIECLTALADAGHRMCVASSKPLVFVERVLEHFKLTSFFDGIFGSELDGTRTDKTDLLRYVLEQTGLDPSGCTMVGDRKHDIIGALSNGLRPIGVLYGFGSRQELEEAGAATLVESIADLLPELVC